MKLLSINIGVPRIVVTAGRSVETGIFKLPVSGPVKVNMLNLDGDRQADLSVHGGANKAVYVYSWKNVEYWKEFLRRDDLGPGTFGENLTVDELLDTEISIGDELGIGTARFLVTQPRFPCFKLGIKLGQPAFVKIFDSSGRNGFYLRVLREGIIEAGDKIQKTSNQDAGKVTVAEFVRIYRTRKATRETILQLLGLDALPESMKSWLKKTSFKSAEILKETFKGRIE